MYTYLYVPHSSSVLMVPLKIEMFNFLKYARYCSEIDCYRGTSGSDIALGRYLIFNACIPLDQTF